MKGPGFFKHGGFGKIGFLNKQYTGNYRPSIVCQPGYVDCPELKKKVHFTECLECDKFQVWHEKDGEMKRCYHEFKDLESRGFYDGTWDDHPENFDPDTFAEIQERKCLNEEVNRELEQEFAEYESKAEELKEDPSYYYGDHWMEDGEEPEEDNSDDEEDYF